ncbi:MAG: Smr/MutS family protein [Steroidobacteraceae bacterium]
MAKHRTSDTTADADATDDALAFRAAVRDVKPLAKTALANPLKPRPRARRRTMASARASGELDELMPLVPDASPADDAIAGADALSFRRPDVRTHVLRRLRRGLYPVEDELDLHGLSQSAARSNLADFIAFNRSAGHRCVRIIHGKGYRSGARGPILKIAVNSWLRRHSDVMAFASARALDGGTGAVYVLLRA